MSFESFGLSESMLAVIQQKGFTSPSPIQEQAIPLLLKNDVDVIGQAQTGTGKTAAFAIPILEKLVPEQKRVQAIVLTPTRELALQVTEEINSLSPHKRLSILSVYGGVSIERQITGLKKGAHLVVGTPGRVQDLIKRKVLQLETASFFILDEADEMLNMGFVDDIRAILSHLPEHRNMLLFSATMPPQILALSREFMRSPEIIKVKSQALTTASIKQFYFEVPVRSKFAALTRLLDATPDFYGVIFCKTKADVDQLSLKLTAMGYSAEGLHGDIAQNSREKILEKFRKGYSSILIATDVAARGIDVDNLTHVVNFTLPQEPETYVHRIGRTGRAGRTGIAWSIVPPSDRGKIKQIAKVAKAEIEEAELPKANEIVKAKKNRIVDQVINSLMQDTPDPDYLDMAYKILVQTEEPAEALAALLKIQHPGIFDENKYTIDKPREKERSAPNGRRKSSDDGNERLFIALGKKDGMTARKLVNFVQKETNVSQKKMDQVKIMNEFSFMTVPEADAHSILKAFRRKKKKGEKPLVDRAQ